MIHARPDRRDSVMEALSEMPGLNVAGKDVQEPQHTQGPRNQGPLIATLSSATSDDVSIALLSIMDIAGVVNAVLTDHIPGRGDNA